MPLIPVICHLVLTVREGLSFLVDDSSESLLQLLDSELKVPPHLLYKHVSLIYLSPPCQKHNFKVPFLDLEFVSEISILCNSQTIEFSLEDFFELFQRVIKSSQEIVSPDVF